MGRLVLLVEEGGVVCCRSRQTSGWVNRLMGVRGGEARCGEEKGERQECCAGGNSAVLQTPLLYVEDSAASILFPRPCSGLNFRFAQPLNITTLFTVFLPCLIHSPPPQACGPLNRLSSLDPLNHPPLQVLPYNPISLSSIHLSLFLSLPSSPPLITSLGFVRNRSPDEGEAIAASALILWKLISRTELQIPPPGTPAFERQGSV